MHSTWSQASRIDALDGLGPFVAVVEAGSFSAAARALDVPRETLSRQVAALEERLGAQLLHRTTRRITLTAAGAELYRRGTEIVAAVESAVSAVRATDGVPRGRLRITLPASGGPFALLIREFLTAYPAVELEVVCTNRHVDLIGEGFDVAVRAGVLRDMSLVSRLLGRSRTIAVASPAYLRQRGKPEVPGDLVRHACLRGLGGGARPVTAWPLADGGEVPVTGPLSIDDVLILRQFAVEGVGIALLPLLMIPDELAQGQLVQVVPEVTGASTVAAVFPEGGNQDPKVRAFVDHAVLFWRSVGFDAL